MIAMKGFTSAGRSGSSHIATIAKFALYSAPSALWGGR
jgi:hypothetical protein